MDSQYDMRVTVPVLWDKQTEQIVNNESSDIIIMLNNEFNQFTNSKLDLYPEEMRTEIDEINQDKRKRALWFIDALEGFPELEWHRVDSSRHNYHLLVAQMSNGRRDEFISKMAFEKGVQCIVQYCPLNRYPLYKKAGFGKASCPNADKFFDNMISFPFHHLMTDEELDYMLQSTIEVLKEIRDYFLDFIRLHVVASFDWGATAKASAQPFSN